MSGLFLSAMWFKDESTSHVVSPTKALVVTSFLFFLKMTSNAANASPKPPSFIMRSIRANLYRKSNGHRNHWYQKPNVIAYEYAER